MTLITRLEKALQEVADMKYEVALMKQLLVFALMTKEEGAMTRDEAFDVLTSPRACACYGPVGVLRSIPGAPCACLARVLIARQVLGLRPDEEVSNAKR